MKTYNLEPKYNVCLDEIMKLKDNNNLSWEKIEEIGLKENAVFEALFPEDYKEKWSEMVEYLKHIKNDAKVKEAYFYDPDSPRNEIIVPDNKNSAWVVFKNKLREKFKGIETINNTQRGATQILKSLRRETINNESGKGLVVGYVQSGKTTNIESVITMGADYNYNVFIMLSGTIENLRKQNLERLKQDIEYSESSNVEWNFIDDIKKANIDGILVNSRKRIVTVCLKNSTRLKNLKKWLIDSTSPATKRKMNVILIDDEADQASLNTKKMINDEDVERTKINKLIIEIVNFKGFHSMNYISYTATPYGNFLNENSEESLYPRDFIYSLPKSSQYVGASEIFGDENSDDGKEDGLDLLERIDDNDYEKMKNLNPFTMDFPESLKNAICWFICTLAIFRYKKSLKSVSMLVHTDVKQSVHKQTAETIEKWLNQNKSHLINECKKVYEHEKNKLTKEDFFKIMTNYNVDSLHPVEDYPEFDEIQEEIEKILNDDIYNISINDKGDKEFHRGIHLVIDNSDNKNGVNENGKFIRLAYPEKNDVDFATGMIVIGGNTLARGLTLEGLTTSYFARKVSQADSLMQMGRWFGYRIGYELLPRIWLTQDAEDKFKEVAYIENRLREDIKKYEFGTKPSEYAPKIRSSYITRFLVTSRNKSQNASRVGATYEKVDNQTVIFDRDEEMLKNNKEIAISFIKYIIENFKNANNTMDDNYIYNNIEYSSIKEKLFNNMKFYKNDRFFGQINDFFRWMELNEKDERLNNWDVIIENDNGEKTKRIKINSKISISKVNRSQRIKHVEGTFDLGVLRNPKDRERAFYYEDPEKNKNGGELMEVTRPKLFIYFVDGKSTVSRKRDVDKESKRMDLDLNTDFVGFYLYIPNTNKKNKDREILSMIMKEE